MMKPIVIESTEIAEGVVKTDMDAWKRGPTPSDTPFKIDVEPEQPADPGCEKLKINDALRDC